MGWARPVEGPPEVGTPESACAAGAALMRLPKLSPTRQKPAAKASALSWNRLCALLCALGAVTLASDRDLIKPL